MKLFVAASAIIGSVTATDAAPSCGPTPLFSVSCDAESAEMTVTVDEDCRQSEYRKVFSTKGDRFWWQIGVTDSDVTNSVEKNLKASLILQIPSFKVKKPWIPLKISLLAVKHQNTQLRLGLVCTNGLWISMETVFKIQTSLMRVFMYFTGKQVRNSPGKLCP